MGKEKIKHLFKVIQSDKKFIATEKIINLALRDDKHIEFERQGIPLTPEYSLDETIDIESISENAVLMQILQDVYVYEPKFATQAEAEKFSDDANTLRDFPNCEVMFSESNSDENNNYVKVQCNKKWAIPLGEFPDNVPQFSQLFTEKSNELYNQAIRNINPNEE
jgi:hypothetical protein